MALTDYEELAARSFEEPHDPELRAAVLVCADALTEIDDPRGPLIAMEHALRDADHRRAIELRRAMHEHAAGEAAGLLGAAAPLMYAGRTLALEWRSGKLYGMTIDARYVPRKSRMSAGELVVQALKAPAARDLRRLNVRVREQVDFDSITGMMTDLSHKPPIEELAIYTSVWPQRMVPTQQRFLAGSFPDLYYVVQLDRTLSLPLTGDRTPELYIPEIRLCDPPTSRPARVFLGRALTHGHVGLRVAALERVAELGALATVFERVLCTLLQPGIAGPSSIAGHVTSEPHLPIVQALRAIGPSAAAVRALDKITSRAEYYDAETRSAAGTAAAEARAR